MFDVIITALKRSKQARYVLGRLDMKFSQGAILIIDIAIATKRRVIDFSHDRHPFNGFLRGIFRSNFEFFNVERSIDLLRFKAERNLHCDLVKGLELA